MINLAVTWTHVWHYGLFPSRYDQAAIDGNKVGIDTLHRRRKTGQLRVYSDADMQGLVMVVNGGAPQTLRRAGRHGRLYLGFEEQA